MKCEFQKHDGTICSANAQVGKDVCIFHDPAKAEDRHRARRAGGLARSKPAILPADVPDVPLGTYKDVANLLAESISQVRRGELDARISNAIGYLSAILLKALEQGVMEEPSPRSRLCSGWTKRRERNSRKNDHNPQAN